MFDVVEFSHVRARTLRTGQPLRVVTWNVWYRSKADRVLKILEALDADVILLQEVTQRSRWNPDENIPARIAEELGYNGVFAECRRNRRMSEGIALFSRFCHEDVFLVQLCQGGYWRSLKDSLERRCYLEVTLSVEREGGKAVPLTIATAHFPYAVPGRGESRRESFHKLRRELTMHDDTFVFGGDLNLYPRSAYIQNLLWRFSNLGPPLHEPSVGFRMFGRMWGRRMDYVLGTRDLRGVHAKFITDSPSNHFPLVAEIELKSMLSDIALDV